MTTSSDPCPVTHFRCGGHDVYCLPVYMRCNEIKDCPDGEDEVTCGEDEVTCPGFYRCRASSVCLHVHHLCDGWPQCPQRDDELLCDAKCPTSCHCQGLAFVCPQPFQANNFPDLCYLDAEGSGIVPSQLTENFYLVYLSLAACGLDTWPEAVLPNLQRLDLSDNNIDTLLIQNFIVLQNLRFLRLKGNPLTRLIMSDSTAKQERLTSLDLSHTKLFHFNSTDLINLHSIRFLNLTYSGIHTVSKEGFSQLPKLVELDLTGCDIEKFPREMFLKSAELTTIHASNYRLCCKAMLPDQFEEKFCFAPTDEISSCDDLLRSDFYRVFLWLIGMLSVLGNAGCLVFKLVVQRGSITRSGYNVFVTSLGVADLLMGVYLAIVGTADSQYRGRYLWHDRTWKNSMTCKVGGFLSLLSSEVSALMICLITLDRFIVLRFPFSTFRFKARSAATAVAIAWVGGFLLAAVPLLSPLSHWRFYSQTGICIPLPVTRNTFRGRGYSFGVMIIFNFVLFLSIAVGQVMVYWSIRANSMTTTDATLTSRDLTIARRLITVVVSDFLCWFPIGVLGLLAYNGTPIPGEVSVAMAIFVLPLNSALNPFLYTLNIVLERRRKAQEDRLHRILRAQGNGQQSQLPASTQPK